MEVVNLGRTLEGLRRCSLRVSEDFELVRGDRVDVVVIEAWEGGYKNSKKFGFICKWPRTEHERCGCGR